MSAPTIRTYKWTILVDGNGIYTVSGCAFVNGVLDSEIPTARWSYVEGALEHIRKTEQDREAFEHACWYARNY